VLPGVADLQEVLRSTEGRNALDGGPAESTDPATPPTQQPEAALDLRDASSSARDVDLRSGTESVTTGRTTSSPARGADAPSLFLRMPSPGTDIHLGGRGGSEGGSLL
jgi:hypothetical protein